MTVKYRNLLLAIAFWLSAIFWQLFGAGRSLIIEGRPTFDTTSLTPVLLIAIASALFLSSWPRQQLPLAYSTNSRLENFIDVWGSRCVLVGCRAILAVFVFRPNRFAHFAREDGLIESLSAGLPFVSGAILLYLSIFRSRTYSQSLAERLFLVGCTAIFFLIGLEEVSWFQRDLGIETPEFFERNLQGELNFHNFATNFFENLYYGAAFASFVLAPYLYACSTWLRRRLSAKLVPGLAPFVAVAISCSYNYDMWIGIPMQIALWLAALIVLDQARQANTEKRSFVLWASVTLMAISQLVYLVRGEMFVRLKDITEYREYLVAVGIFLYAIELLVRRRMDNAIVDRRTDHTAERPFSTNARPPVS